LRDIEVEGMRRRRATRFTRHAFNRDDDPTGADQDVFSSGRWPPAAMTAEERDGWQPARPTAVTRGLISGGRVRSSLYTGRQKSVGHFFMPPPLGRWCAS